MVFCTSLALRSTTATPVGRSGCRSTRQSYTDAARIKCATFASQAGLQAVGPITAVKKQLGHRDSAITLRYWSLVARHHNPQGAEWPD